MKFFKPDLYVRFNSRKDEEAVQADSDWEEALRDYESHLSAIRASMPARVKELADKWCLHDAEVVSIQKGEPLVLTDTLSFPVQTVLLKRDGELIVLLYLLWDKPHHSRPSKRQPFSAEDRHWLYDEVDLDARSSGHFWHRALLSDGSTLDVPFVDVFVQTVPLTSLAGTAGKRKRA